MDVDIKRKKAAILRILAEAGGPLGGARIARELAMRGIRLRPRMVRYYLEEMDARGFTKNLGRAGRTLTGRGRLELQSAVAVDRVGFISARVDELAYRQSFDLERRCGSVILNVSLVPALEFTTARDIARDVMRAGLGMGCYAAIARPGRTLAGVTVPAGHVALGTVCSVTLNGVFCAHGIPTVSRFGGIVELRERRPVRFSQIICYDGTTIDPIEIFIKGKMTSVRDAVRSGAGVVGASFREIPAAALERASRLVEELARAGLGGVLAVGLPGEPVADIPVAHGRVGLVVAAGLNPVAAIEEAGIATENKAMSALCEFEELSPVFEGADICLSGKAGRTALKPRA